MRQIDTFLQPDRKERPVRQGVQDAGKSEGRTRKKRPDRAISGWMDRPDLKGCRLPASCRGTEAYGPEATTLDKEVDTVTEATTVQSHEGDGWASIDWAAATRVVQRLQQRIFRASQQGRWRQVHNLQKLLLRSDANLVLSVRQVTQVSDGRATPGVDGRVATTAKGRWRLLNDLRQARPHRPQPMRRVYIPKANGKLRALGIATIEDRVRQHVVKTALEPAWEAHFEATSYGFRPGRSVHDAIGACFNRLNGHSTARWVLDADIRGAFDHISHAYIGQRLGNLDRKSTRLNSSHSQISYAVFCLKKKKNMSSS